MRLRAILNNINDEIKNLVYKGLNFFIYKMSFELKNNSIYL